MQRAGGLTGVGVALDRAVRRVRGVPGDAADLQCPGVDPGSVHVAVEQEHRPVTHDRVEVALPAADLVERHGEPVASRGRRVDMGVLEPGDDHPPGQVQGVDRRADPVAHLGLGADSHDAVTAQRDSAGPRSCRVPAVHLGSGDDHVCGLVHGRYSLAAG